MIKIRQEEKDDYSTVFNVIKKAFKKVEISDQSEPFLVERLRKSEVFIPKLSLVAEKDDNILGHIILSKINIKKDGNSFPSLALAPVSVLPEFQGNGIGSLLIKTAHDIANELGHTSIILIGHENYYPRFGYRPCNLFNITFPFEVPDKNAMAIELSPNALNGIEGEVEYSAAFFG